MTNRKTTSTCPPPYGRRSYDSRNNETLNPLKFYKRSLCQTQRGAAARCPREEHVDCRCQRSPVRALCFLSVPGRPQLVAKSSCCFPVCAPTLPVSRQKRRRPGEKQTPLIGLRLAAQLCLSLPQATCPRPPPGVPPGPAPAAAKAHVKLQGGGSARRWEFADANPGLGREAIPGRTRRAKRPGGACLPQGLRTKGERVALRSPRTRYGLAPPMSVRAAVVASFLQTRPARLLNLAEACSESREVWGEVAGASHACAASEKREGAGEIRDNVTPSTPNQEPA
ncbi:uncharacterized protein LOC129059190 [Pongo abelii]|uniref:uncharacterized protein LOC129059190 n=1 Tax=Pongo abelii TaxID=9601 RepID=UPI0023E75F40|nr:uncharacterized protein LOC129059190 [Pongo abelii]